MKKYVVVVISIVLVLCVGVSYSYFTSDINNKESKLKISSKDLSIVLTDNMELNSDDITPGWSDSKSFTIKNNSNGSYNYNIVLEDLVNTFVTEGFLQYKITSTNGYNTEGYINIPKSESPQDIVIGYDIDIDKRIIQEYQIEFIYRDSEDVDQSEDMGKIFKGTLAIEEGTVNPNIKYSVTLNVENATIDNNPKETIKKGSVEFNVEPNEGYTLGTTVTCDNNAIGVIENGKVTISNITANTICTLNNDINTYTIEMKVINGKSNALNKIVEFNENAEFTITPNTGYTLTGATLEGEGCSIEGNIVSVSNVKSNGTCTLTLVKDKYEVILTGSNVTVTGSPKTVEYEGSTTFNVSPNTGFTMSEATVNCDGGASAEINGNTVTISNVLKEQKCTITPKQITYEVELVVVNGTGNTIKTIAHGGRDTFNITASDTYTLDSPTISCDGSASTSYTNGELTVSNVTGNQTCTVTLKHTSYIVTVTSNNNNYGTVSPTSQSVIHGNSATITLSPKIGYKYSSNDCGGTVSGNTMTISNVTTDKTCSITFENSFSGYYYVMLNNGYTYKYDKNETQLSSNINNGKFTVEYTGEYTLELHGGGGGGSGAAICVGNDYHPTTKATGSGGGGSGEIYNIHLSYGEVYDFSIGAGGTYGNYCYSSNFSTCNSYGAGNGGNTIFGTYKVNGGNAGEAAQAGMDFSKAGKGGTANGFLAKDGSDGSTIHYSSLVAGKGGSGGSTIGTYGSRGNGGYDGGSSCKYCSGTSGQPGAIILRIK